MMFKVTPKGDTREMLPTDLFEYMVVAINSPDVCIFEGVELESPEYFRLKEQFYNDVDVTYYPNTPEETDLIARGERNSRRKQRDKLLEDIKKAEKDGDVSSMEKLASTFKYLLK